MSENKDFNDMTCPHCGAMRNIDSNHEFITCPFCGASEPVAESDKVKIERIKSRTARDIAAEDAAKRQETELRKAEINNVSDSIKGGLELLGRGSDLIGQGNQIINKAEGFVRRIIFFTLLAIFGFIGLIVLLVVLIRALV